MSDPESQPEVVMFGGKGGVGKTTCASATAVALSNSGKRTLLVSTDPAHSISDVFTADIGNDPVYVEDNLYAAEVDPTTWFEEQYSDQLEGILEKAGKFGIDVDEGDVDDVVDEGVIPGADELAVVDLFAKFTDTTEWDAVVYDTAPTGHTLRMLQLPDLAGEALSKAVKVKAGIDNVTSFASGLLGGGDDEDDNLSLSEDVDKAQSRMETVSEIIKDEDRTSFNIVTNPEKMALAETRRLYDQLDSEGVPSGTIIANKVRMNIDDGCEYCRAQREEQQELLSKAESDIDADFHRVPSMPNLGDRERVNEIAEDIPV